MTVKVIPISPEYRANWDSVFSRGRAASYAEEDKTLRVAPGSTDRVYMTSPLPASWGLVDGRKF